MQPRATASRFGGQRHLPMSCETDETCQWFFHRRLVGKGQATNPARFCLALAMSDWKNQPAFVNSSRPNADSCPKRLQIKRDVFPTKVPIRDASLDSFNAL